MREKKRFELRSNGQPRAAVPTLFIWIAAIFVVCAGGAWAQSGAASQAMDASAPKTAGQQYKNIQVLKGVPASQLIPTMQFITASLGV